MTRTLASFAPAPHLARPADPLALGLVALHHHPDTPQDAVKRLTVATALEADGRLTLHYCLRGAPGRLRIADANDILPADRLWAHTCFEVFLASTRNTGYREFNFAPSGQWSSYAFSGYRERAPAAPPAAPQLEILHSGDLLTLSATLPADMVPPAAELRLGLATVVEAADGTLSYWALAHPATRPDFHDAGGFCWRASPPQSSR